MRSSRGLRDKDKGGVSNSQNTVDKHIILNTVITMDAMLCILIFTSIINLTF